MISGVEDELSKTGVPGELKDTVLDVLRHIEERLKQEVPRDTWEGPVAGNTIFDKIVDEILRHNKVRKTGSSPADQNTMTGGIINVLPGTGQVSCKPIVFAIETMAGPPWASRAIPALRRHLNACAPHVQVAICIAPMTKFGKKTWEFLDDVQSHMASGRLLTFLPIGIFDREMTLVKWAQHRIAGRSLSVYP